MRSASARRAWRLDRDRPGEHALDRFSREHPGRRAARDGPALRQDQHLVGKARRQIHVVRDHQGREPLGVHEQAHQLEQLHFVPQVERRRGLIQHEQLGFLGEGARQPDALVFTPGKRPQPTVGQVHRVARDQRPLDRCPIGGAHAAEQREVRVAPQENRLVHPLREQVLLPLRHDAHHARQIPA